MNVHSICLHAHQPCRLKRYTFFDIGRVHDYEDSAVNAALTHERVTHLFLPANEKMLRMIDKNNGRFKVALSISGITLEQWERYAPRVLTSFRKLADTGCVEFLAVPYYDSFASFLSISEFTAQLDLHRKKVRNLFNRIPETVCNTKLMYHAKLARVLERLKYPVMIIDEACLEPGDIHANPAFRTDGCRRLACVAVQRSVSPHTNLDGFVNVLTGYDMPGPDSNGGQRGIIDFLDRVSTCIDGCRDTIFTLPSEIGAHCAESRPETGKSASLCRPRNHNLSAWITSELQHDALHTVYDLTQKAKTAGASDVLPTCRMLQAVEHFTAMAPGQPDGHGLKGDAPFHGSPYDMYINFMNIMADIEERICR